MVKYMNEGECAVDNEMLTEDRKVSALAPVVHRSPSRLRVVGRDGGFPMLPISAKAKLKIPT